MSNKRFDTAGRQYSYTYDGNDRLSEVLVEVLGTPDVTVAKVEYDYYDGTDGNGEDGDLKLVTITTPLTDDDEDNIATTWLVRKKYYRYYDDDTYHAQNHPGYAHQIKYVLEFEGTRRFSWDEDGSLSTDDFLTADDGDLEPYASAAFEYEQTTRRIATAWFNGDCGCGGSANGTHALAYEDNSLYSDGAGYDTEWATRTVVQRPDGTYQTQYFDEVGQPLHRVTTTLDPTETSGQETWITKVVRNGDGQITEIHSPANVTDYVHTIGSSWTIDTSTSVGLVTHYVRYGSGLYETGFLNHMEHSQGTGTAYFDSTLKYTHATLSVGTTEVVRPFVSSRWVYTLETDNEAGDGGDPAGAYETTYTYDFYGEMGEDGSPLDIEQLDMTYPAVSTANNGSGSATTAKVLYDEAGRMVFEKTADDIINYWQYRDSDGRLEKTIQDADSSDSEIASCYGTVPAAFASSGTELHRVTCYTYVGGGGAGLTPPTGSCACELDAQGNSITEGDGPTTVSYTEKLVDGRIATLSFSDFEDPETGSDKYYGPVTYAVTNHAGATEFRGLVGLSVSTADPTTFIDQTDDDPILALGVGSLTQLSTSLYSESGRRLTESREYYAIPGSGEGTEGSNFDPTLLGYDDMGRTVRVKDATGTIRRTVYDTLGRTSQQWLGTNDEDETGTDDMVQTVGLEYDSGNDGGNSHLTTETLYLDGETPPATRETSYVHDLRGRVLRQDNPAAPDFVLNKYDNLGRLVASGLYKTSVASSKDPTAWTTNRLSLSQTFFDELGRVWKTQDHKITSSGTDSDNLQVLTWYDAAGRVIKVDGTQLTKTVYDRLGRQTHEFVLARAENSSGGAETAYADAFGVDDDLVVQERQMVYESNDSDDMVMTAVIDRFHDDYGSGETTGALDSNSDGNPLKYTDTDIAGRIQFTANWYDGLGRLTDEVQYGTNGGATFDRTDLDVPTPSDDELVTNYSYNDDGTILEITDPRELVTRFAYDAAGRQTKVVNNYDDGVPSADTDQTVTYEYTDGLPTKMTADLPGTTDDQETLYFYGVTEGTGAGDSKITVNNLLQKVQYPDSAGGTDVVTFAYNAQGEPIWTKDQEENVMETDYDDLGRELHRRWTTPATGFDTAVRRITTAYDADGRVQTVTQYDDPDVGEGNVVDEVKYGYDDWGNVSSFKQDRDSTVGSSGVDEYAIIYNHAKATDGRNTLRRTRMELPNGDELFYSYEAGNGLLDDDVSRVTKVRLKRGQTSVYLTRYWYNGIGQIVGTIYLEPSDDVQWELYGSTSGDYPALDRFDRVTSCTWTKALSTPVDFYDVDVSYDRNSNVTTTVDNVFTDTGGGFFDVKYALDNLNRLTKSQWGDWDGSSLTNEQRQTDWTLTQTGNWDVVQLDLDDDDAYDSGTGEFKDNRDHNDVNELIERDPDDDTGTTNIDLLYDKVGNLIDDGENYAYEYDGFGRLRKVWTRDATPALVAEYTYNGLGYRLGWHYDVDADGTVEDTSDDPWYFFAYDEAWRMVAMYLEDDDAENADELVELFANHAAGVDGRGGSSAVDAVILRDRDTDLDGTIDERRYYCQNWRGDVVVVLTENGEIAERAKYSAYGIPYGMPLADLNADGTVDDTLDLLKLLAWYTPGYDVRGDLDLDGVVGSADLLAYLGNIGATLGWGALSDIGNRKGYAGYEFDPALEASYSLYHVRRRVLNSQFGRWITRDPLGYVDGVNFSEYMSSSPLAQADPYGTGPSSIGGRRAPSGGKRDSCGPGVPDCQLTPGGPGRRPAGPPRELGLGKIWHAIGCWNCMRKLRKLGKKTKCNRRALEDLCYKKFQYKDDIKLAECIEQVPKQLNRCLNELAKSVLPGCVKCVSKSYK